MSVMYPELNDSLDDLLGRTGTPEEVAAAPRITRPLPPALAEHREKCTKCGGTGHYRAPSSRGSHCFACQGRGYNVFKNSAEDRARARAKGAERKAAKEAKRAQEAAHDAALWLAGQPEVAAWFIAQQTNEFARSLHAALQKWGALTDNQLAAVWRSIERDKTRAAEQAARAAVAPAVDTGALKAAFDAAARRAQEKGLSLKYPKITVGKVVISPAGASSRNPGALYVKDAGQYIGKIQDGKFYGTRECTPEAQARVLAFIADPRGSAKAYGLETGICCICGAELKSAWKLRGIGPICAEKFGWG